MAGKKDRTRAFDPTLEELRAGSLNPFQPEDEEGISDDPEVNQTEEKINTELKDRFTNLELDIQHVDDRLRHIHGYIIELDLQVQNLKQLIKNEQDPSKKGKFYGVMNECLKLIAMYEDLYQKCLHTKFNYRREQNELSTRKLRLTEVDTKKLGPQDDTTLTPTKLVHILQNLNSVLGSASSDINLIGGGTPELRQIKQIQSSIAELDSDPDLKL